MSQFPQNPKQWVQYPEEKGLYTVRVDSLEASTKFEGKWIVQAQVEGLGELKFWVSHKQAGSIHKNLDAPELFAVIDTGNKDKPRFVWCSNNREWLENAFLKPKDGEDPKPAPVAKEAPKKAFKKSAGQVQPNRFDNPTADDLELPF